MSTRQDEQKEHVSRDMFHFRVEVRHMPVVFAILEKGLVRTAVEFSSLE